jgi:hypothetical protein
VRRFLVPFLAGAAIGLTTTTTIAQPSVWSGLTFSFIKTGYADPELAENQDRLTEHVWLTRGDDRGLLNAVDECGFTAGCGYTSNFSPADTEWATNLVPGNAGLAIAASNWQQLQFTDWEAAYGDRVGTLIVGRDAVVHLITDDIYLDLRFTTWSSALSGGFFSYLRGEPPMPSQPDGDYNHNGIVGLADYTVWRDTLGQTIAAGQGADGNESGTIDAGDYGFWKTRFGDVTNRPSATSGSLAVPEPSTALLCAMVAIALWLPWRYRCIYQRPCMPRGPYGGREMRPSGIIIRER